MKRIKWIYGGLFLTLSLLWAFAEQPWAQHYNFFDLRAALVNYTGILTMGAMSVAMMLAIRPMSVEPWLGGLDKGYRLHKWLGITGLATGVVHWLWAKGPKWAVGWGWLTRPQRGPRPQLDNPVFQSFLEWRGFAENIGEFAFYAAAALIVLALVKRFPYRWFFKTHRVIAAVYLVLAFHAIVLIKFPYWQSALAWVMLLLVAGGTVGAVLSLTRRIGHRRRAPGRIEALDHHTDNHVLKVDVRLDGDVWKEHDAGQFAFVTFDDGEGAHPFTVSSAWTGDGLLHFHIKNLGDYTARLASMLKPGDCVTVEGPYGCFRFESDKPRQIWVAGGIGITPFIARMEALAWQNPAAGAGNPPESAVDLFYSTGMPDEAFIARLRRLAEAAGVALRVIANGRDRKLDGESLCAAAPAWRESSLWFCGPAGFGHALHRDLVSRGFDPAHFHRELFDMR
ncbi:MAG: ferric reductase-like transmembrane domain-containing protein [Azoarcus sp.]|jgi:predicted ferric reductase|nr:ferric reductase-like transmembrane domain-containing protein [Azoarcus sp.]